MTDALERAAKAIYEGVYKPETVWLTWDEIPEVWREGHREDALAALKVIADEIWALHPHRPHPAFRENGRCERCLMEWPCPTVQVLDHYVGIEGRWPNDDGSEESNDEQPDV